MMVKARQVPLDFNSSGRVMLTRRSKMLKPSPPSRRRLVLLDYAAWLAATADAASAAEVVRSSALKPLSWNCSTRTTTLYLNAMQKLIGILHAWQLNRGVGNQWALLNA